MNKESRLLFLYNYSPIIHGASLIGNNIRNIVQKNPRYNCKHINTSLSKSSKEIGRFKLIKLFLFFKTLISIIYYRLTFKPQLYYTVFEMRDRGLYLDFVRHLFIPRSKRVIHIHNDYDPTIGWFKSFLIRLSFSNSTLIVITNKSASNLRSHFSSRNIYILNNGIEDVYFQFDHDCQSKPDEKLRLLFCSNLFRYKGIIDLIKFLAILPNRYTQHVEVEIIGGEGDFSITEIEGILRKYKIESFVKILGKKTGDEKWKVFSKSDIFIFPTYYDSFPTVILEALMFGIPVIAYETGGVPEMIISDVNGILINQGDIDALSEKLIFYIENEEVRKIHSINARKSFLAKYHLDLFKFNFINIIDNCLQDLP